MKKILVIAAHMDDEVLGLGGTICRHAKGDTLRTYFSTGLDFLAIGNYLSQKREAM